MRLNRARIYSMNDFELNLRKFVGVIWFRSLSQNFIGLLLQVAEQELLGKIRLARKIL